MVDVFINIQAKEARGAHIKSGWVMNLEVRMDVLEEVMDG